MDERTADPLGPHVREPSQRHRESRWPTGPTFSKARACSRASGQATDQAGPHVGAKTHATTEWAGACMGGNKKWAGFQLGGPTQVVYLFLFLFSFFSKFKCSSQIQFFVLNFRFPISNIILMWISILLSAILFFIFLPIIQLWEK
jgi:hypothetical protein